MNYFKKFHPELKIYSIFNGILLHEAEDFSFALDRGFSATEDYFRPLHLEWLESDRIDKKLRNSFLMRFRSGLLIDNNKIFDSVIESPRSLKTIIDQDFYKKVQNTLFENILILEL